MKDPEPGEPRCPDCGTLGEPVGGPTLDAQLSPELRAPLGGTVHYCAGAACLTAYFNAWGARAGVDRLRSPAWPKSAEAPICPCFGATAAEVEADAREGFKERVKALLERAKGPEARCTQACPDGRPCSPRVMRLFRDCFAEKPPD